jgi:hypothetical protein
MCDAMDCATGGNSSVGGQTNWRHQLEVSQSAPISVQGMPVGFERGRQRGKAAQVRDEQRQLAAIPDPLAR